MNNFYLLADEDTGAVLVDRLEGGDQQQQQQICIRFLSIFYFKEQQR